MAVRADLNKTRLSPQSKSTTRKLHQLESSTEKFIVSSAAVAPQEMVNETSQRRGSRFESRTCTLNWRHHHTNVESVPLLYQDSLCPNIWSSSVILSTDYGAKIVARSQSSPQTVRKPTPLAPKQAGDKQITASSWELPPEETPAGNTSHGPLIARRIHNSDLGWFKSNILL